MKLIQIKEEGKRKTIIKFFPEINEYEVTLFDEGDRADDGTYFTDDKEDAIATATAMRQHGVGK